MQNVTHLTEPIAEAFWNLFWDSVQAREVYDVTLERTFLKLKEILQAQGLDTRHWLALLSMHASFADFAETSRGKPLAHMGDSTSKMGAANDANEADKWMDPWMQNAKEWKVPHAPLTFAEIHDFHTDGCFTKDLPEQVNRESNNGNLTRLGAIPGRAKRTSKLLPPSMN